jgi:hypothetical protein
MRREPLLQVLHPGPGTQAGLDVAAVADRAEQLRELRLHLFERDQLILRGAAEEQVLDRVQPLQLGHRIGVVVHAQVDQQVVVSAVAAAGLADDHGRRLAAAAVTPGLVARLKRDQHPLDQRPHGRLERVGEGRHHGRPGQQVALRGIAVARAAAGPVEAAGSGERRAAAGRVDDADLALLALGVGGGQPVDCLLRRRACGEELKAVRPVRDVGKRLRGDRPGLGARPRHDRADRQELRRHDHSPLPPLAVACDQRERHSRVSPGASSSTSTPEIPRASSSSRRPWGVPDRAGKVP